MANRKRPTFRPEVECLEGRLVPSTVYWTNAAGNNHWDTAGNWSTLTVPTNGDDVVFDKAHSGNAYCDHAGSSTSGALHSLTVTGSYTATITLGATLYTGGPPTRGNSGNNSLNYAALDVAGYTLHLEGTADQFNNFDFLNNGGLGRLEISTGDVLTDNSTATTKEYAICTIDSGGEVTFPSGAGWDFGAAGTLTVNGVLMIAPTTPAAVTFSASNTAPWTVNGSGAGVGVMTANDSGFTVTVPVGLNTTGSAVVTIMSGTYLDFNGNVALGRSGSGDAGVIDLQAGAFRSSPPSWAGSTALGADLISIYGDGQIGMSHLATNKYGYVNGDLSLFDSSTINADTDGSGEVFSGFVAPVLGVQGTLSFYGNSDIVVRGYKEAGGGPVQGCDLVACSSLYFSLTSPVSRVQVVGTWVSGNHYKFVVALGGYSGTPWNPPNTTGWTETTDSFPSGEVDFYLNTP